MTSYEFNGEIALHSNVAFVVSAYAETSWDTDVATVPGQVTAAYRKTSWDTDTATACEFVSGIVIDGKEW